MYKKDVITAEECNNNNNNNNNNFIDLKSKH